MTDVLIDDNALGSLDALIRLITDPEGCRKRLDDLRAAHADVQAKIDEHAGLAAATAEHHAEAKAFLAEADSRKADTESLLGQIGAARVELAERLGAVAKREEVATILYSNLKDREDKVGERENTMLHREAALSEREAALERKHQDVEAKLAAYDEAKHQAALTLAG